MHSAYGGENKESSLFGDQQQQPGFVGRSDKGISPPGVGQERDAFSPPPRKQLERRKVTDRKKGGGGGGSGIIWFSLTHLLGG